MRQLGVRNELADEVNHHQPTPRTSVLCIDLRLLVTRQVEASLKVELQHLLGTRIQVASRDLLRRSQLLHQSGIQRHLFIGLLHGHKPTTLHANQLRSRSLGLCTCLRKKRDRSLARIITHRRRHQVHQHGLSVRSSTRQNMELLRLVVSRQRRRQVREEVLANRRVRQHIVEELVQLRPAGVCIVRLVRVELQVGAERDVILRLSIAELEGQSVEHAICECDQILVLIHLGRKLLVQEQLATLLHDVLLEPSHAQLLAHVSVRMLLLLGLTEVTACRIVLSLGTLRESVCRHHVTNLILLSQEVAEHIARQAALQRHTLICLTPGVTSEPIPRRRTETRALELIAELCVHNLRHIVLRLRVRCLIQKAINIPLLNLNVSVEVVGARPVTKAADSQLGSVVAEVEPHPLTHRLTRIVLAVRTLRTELIPHIGEIRMDVLQAMSDVRPLIVTVVPIGAQIESVLLIVLHHRLRQRLKIDRTSR